MIKIAIPPTTLVVGGIASTEMFFFFNILFIFRNLSIISYKYMKSTQTAKFKLNITEDMVLPTLSAYTDAYNYVCQVGYDKKNFNGIDLHKLTYRDVRDYLPSQLAISSRVKATENLAAVLKPKKVKKSTKVTKDNKPKKQPKCPHSKLCSIRYDQNSYSLHLDRSEVSILTLNGRLKCNFNIPKYYEKYSTWKYSSADLCLKNHTVYVHVVFEKDIPDIQQNGQLLGVDRGINNIAVSSDNKFYSGKKVKKVCRKYKRIRTLLQRKGTKSAKRHLKRLSGKERRFKADINHQVSKKIVNSLQPGDTIILEKLSGIRNKRLGKPARTLINSWNFFQLESFITYKAVQAGITVKQVDPRFTSQHCPKCGNTRRNNRVSTYFECKRCHFRMNADLVASKNIVLKYLGTLQKKGSLTSDNQMSPQKGCGQSAYCCQYASIE